jgi:hypothetical protein
MEYEGYPGTVIKTRIHPYFCTKVCQESMRRIVWFALYSKSSSSHPFGATTGLHLATFPPSKCTA